MTSANRPAARSRRLARRGALLGAFALAALLLAAGPAAAKPSPEPFEIVPGSFHITPSTTGAGAHEDLTTEFDFAHVESGPEEGQTHNDVKTTVVNLPPGFDGNNTAVPTCSAAQLAGEASGKESGYLSLCPADTQVGTISFDLFLPFEGSKSVKSTFPLYNMEVTSFGTTAALGFKAVSITQILPISVRPGDSGLTVTSPSIEEIGEVHDVSVDVWGVPADPSHDAERGLLCIERGVVHGVATCKGGGETVTIAPKPFLSNPTSCGSFEASMKSNSWEEPDNWSEERTQVGPIGECERVHFDPTIEANPTTDSAESSTGLNFAMKIPQTWNLPESVSTANLRDVKVTLPEGFSLNPSAGSGLGSCTPAEFEREEALSLPGEGCPPESKVGSVEVETPVLTEHATGAVYVARPFDNPFHGLLVLYVVAKIPSRGVIVKVAGKVEPDPVTGQLTTTFKENPQQPFEKFTLKFRQGATSPLSSPPACGTYHALADLTPWSAPETPNHLIGNSFQIDHGVRGGPCPSGGLPPFHPGLTAGSIVNAAGHYSPFYIRLSREDGEQEITHFSIKLPPGVVGKLAGIPFCSDLAIAQAKGREHEQGGAEEEANPSCPAASEVGRTLVEAGVGNTLAQAPGKVYLAGPYHGSPISVVAITSARVGPFDLGTVVVREALRINPETAEVFVDATGSDPLPHIVDGIPTHLRRIRIYMDKPEFVLNPTSCEPTSTASTVLGSGLDFVSEADDRPITVSSPFQAADCASLGYKPRLALRLKGGTKRGGNPALTAILRPRPGDANSKRVSVALPHSEFLDQAHIKTICTRVQFKAGAGNGAECPAGSIYGHAKAYTPLLSEPLEGPIFLRSSEHPLPDLVLALHGLVDFTAVGRIDSVHGGIRNSFETVPDAPISKVVVSFEGGKKGLLENSTNICVGKHRANTEYAAQSGKAYQAKVPLQAQCKSKKKAGHKHKAKRPRQR